MYIVPEDPIRVNYAKFIEDVEIVFTKSVNIKNIFFLGT